MEPRSHKKWGLTPFIIVPSLLFVGDVVGRAQEEIGYYHQKFSADSNAEQCGWLKDKFGVSWQVWPTVMGEMMSKGTKEQVGRLTKAFLAMKKYDIQQLKEAYQGK